MRIADYIRASALDFVLCLVIACFLGLANCGAFFVSPSLQFNPVALIVAAGVPLALLFASAYSRRTVIPGAIATVVVLVASCVVVHAVGGEGLPLRDTVSNPETFVIVVYLGAVLTFLLTRKRWLARAFVLVAALDVCFVEFMYKQFYWYALLAVLVGAGAMAIYRNYRLNLRDASTDSVSFAGAFGVGAGYALALVGVACALFFLVVAPLDPQALEIKLFTRYMTYETIQMTGIGDSSTAPGSASTTNQANDDTDVTDIPPEDDGTQDQPLNGFTLPFDLPSVGALAELAQNGLQRLREMFNYLLEDPIRFSLFIVVVLAALAAPFVLKKRLRARWFAKTCELPPIQCVERFYLFFLKRFGKIKVQKPEESTLAEFAESVNATLSGFDVKPAIARGGESADAGVQAGFGAAGSDRFDFKALTDVYCRGVYGGIAPTESELELYKDYYRKFYKALMEQMGRPRYALRFFTV